MLLIPLLVFSVSLCLCGSSAFAHPVPRGQHDRTIVVHLQPDLANKEVVVRVDYRLEVDELTVILDDMPKAPEQVRFELYKDKRMEFFGEFTRIYAPVLAARLVAKEIGRASCRERVCLYV